MAARARRRQQPRTLSDFEVLAEFRRFFGTRRAMELVGWVVVWSVSGQPTLSHVVEVIQRTAVPRATTYRFIADLNRWRQHYAELEGREVDEIPGLDELVRDLSRRFDRVQDVRAPRVQLTLGLPADKENPA